MDIETLDAVRETASRFGQREIQPMVGTEGRDGELSALAAVLDKATATGLSASADPAAAGYEFGVWGRACLADGDELSLTVLRELAGDCAGTAACLHFAGLGALELVGASTKTWTTSVALLDRSWRPTWSAFAAPPEGASTFADGRLMGSASFVHGAPGSEAYVVYAAGESGWQKIVIPRDAEGLTVQDVGQRTGLAAVEVSHLGFDDIVVRDDWRLGKGDPGSLLRRLMLGIGSIALGNARGALRGARAYAEERYQGGRLIEGHPAIQMLLGESAVRIAAVTGCLTAAARAGTLWEALAAKLTATVECAKAVSDCLQVLGGYGYMEDYRLEKRLRDAMTMEAMVIAPSTLRLLCARDEGGVG